MTIAGYISISTLAAENIIHRPLIEDSSLSEHDLKSKYYLSNKLNIDLNIKRNNYLYASYICIRNALILLIILFGIIAFPINSISYTEKNKVLSTGSFLYSENSTSFINKNTNFSQFENDLKANIDLVSLNDGEKSAFVIESLKIFVKIAKENNMILVLQIESYK